MPLLTKSNKSLVLSNLPNTAIPIHLCFRISVQKLEWTFKCLETPQRSAGVNKAELLSSRGRDQQRYVHIRTAVAPKQQQKGFLF